MDQLETFAKNGKINEEASVKDKQSVVIDAPINEVWKLVADIEGWSEWNSQISEVTKGESNEFKWKFNDMSFDSKISYAEEPYRFCWVAKGSLLKSVYVYKLDEITENKTGVVLEGSMQGFKTYFSFNHRKLHRSFVTWLEDLSRKFQHQ